MRMKAQRSFLAKNCVHPIALRLAALILLLSSIPLCAQSAGITLVQHTSTDAGSSTSSTLAFPSTNTAGNWIGVCVRAGALNEAITVSDTRNNVYLKAVQFNQTVDGFTYAIFYAENIAGGANSVTVSDNILGTLRFAILEYSGVATSGSLDVTATGQGRGTSLSTSPSVTTTANGDLLLGAMMTGNGETFSAGSGYKIEENAPSAQNSKLTVEDQIQTSAGPTVANATIGSSDDWAAGFAAFKAAGGSSGGSPTITGLNPASGGVGTPVTITGTNFGSTQAQGNSTVRFNGVSTNPSSWSATSITAPVPSGATSGNVVVTVNGVASNGFNFTVSPAPSVTINQAASQANPTNGSTINFTAVFSTVVTGFSNSGVTLSGTAGATTAVVTGSGTTYNVAVSGMTQTGTVIASIPAGVATANGVQNTASTSTNNTVTYDITPPSVTINQAAGQANPTSATPINFTVVFSKTVTGLSNAGVTLSGTAGATTAVVTGSGTTYNVAVSGMTQSGTVIASIPAGKATDLAGNLNTASTSTNNTVTFNLSSGLVAAYSFEEGTGTTTADSSGNNNTGTLSSGVTWTTGKIGNAVAFNGTSGDITVNEAPSLDLNGSFTLSAWVKPSTVSGFQTVLIKETTSGCSYFLQITNGQIDSGFNNGSTCVEHSTTTANLSAGNWYYLVAALDHGSNTYNTYLNGVLLSSVAETGVPLPNTQALLFGRSACSSCGFERLNGVLDEVKIYNRALSASEVQALYNVGIAGPTITGLNPASGGVGTPVTITGTNFGSTQAQGNSTVKFNGVSTNPSSWSATSITAPVPSGTTSGNVVVTVNGTPSNGAAFTVTSLFVTISPKRAAVTLSQSQQFAATVANDPLNRGVSWFVDGTLGGNATSGTISSTGLFTPGTQAGVHTITATSNSNTSASATATIAVTDLAGVFTYHNDNARTGQNLQEYALNTGNVNANTFGALFTCAVDGYMYAAPLYVANLNMGTQTRNVVFLATEHDSVYAFDADSPSCVQLWKTSFLSAGVTTVLPSDVSEPNDLVPEIGITSTPVIDSVSGTIYVFAKTKETVGTGCSTASPCFVHRLHALDLGTGTEKFGGPVVFTAPNFNPLTHLQRPALLLNNGVIYIAIGSHGDNGVWQGWLTAYDAATLAQKWVYHTTDPTTGNNGGAIWGSGNGPAVDASGNIYVETGNGTFDGTNNFGDSVLKISPAGVRLDYFTPFDQQIMQTNDIDLGSSNPIILPDSVGSTSHPHLLIAMGKVGVIYLLDQTNLGRFNGASNQDVEEVTISFNTSSAILGFYGQPAYWNGNLYAVVVNDALRQFPISAGSIAMSSSSQSSNTFTFRGATPIVSASGNTNGIVWVADITAYGNNGATILDAYDANNVGTLLYSSPASGTGSAAVATKFTVPTVANGKVYVGGQYAFTVFGLLPN